MSALAVLGLSIASLCAFAGSVWCWRSCSRMATAMRSWHSIAAEQQDIRDRLEKTAALLKRINARETMRERRADAADEAIDGRSLSLKDRLRLKAGIKAGQPVRHTE
jgi:hypothetical protein